MHLMSMGTWALREATTGFHLLNSGAIALNVMVVAFSLLDFIG
jgi:hypothetical protein